MTSNIENYNADELIAPDWLSSDFLREVLCKSENEQQITVKSFAVTPASAKGDHFASVMFRANVEYEVRNAVKCTKSIIIKTEPETEGIKKNLLEQSQLFPTEMGIYGEIMPKFNRILQEIGDETILNIRCLYHSLSPRRIIVLEDIVPLGYKVLRERLSNAEEAEVALTKLAKWHAMSYKLVQDNPHCFDKYIYSFMTAPNLKDFEFLTDGIINFIELLEREPDLRDYKPYFVALKPILLDKSIESFEQFYKNHQSNAFYVLCHGDFHNRNMMFKYHPITDQLEDIVLLDFQGCYMGLPVLDLMYGYFLLLNRETRIKHFDKLRYTYFKTFIETLKKCGFAGRIPQFRELREQWRKHRYFELFLLVTHLPMIYAIYEDNNNFDHIIHSAEKRKVFYRNQMYIDELKVLLPSYLYRGYLDMD